MPLETKRKNQVTFIYQGPKYPDCVILMQELDRTNALGKNISNIICFLSFLRVQNSDFVILIQKPNLKCKEGIEATDLVMFYDQKS